VKGNKSVVASIVVLATINAQTVISHFSAGRLSERLNMRKPAFVFPQDPIAFGIAVVYVA
jgi:hypothetical protein